MSFYLLPTDKRGWVVRLGAGLLFFVLINAGLAFYFAGKETDFYMSRSGLRMKYFNRYEIDAAVKRVARDPGPKIVVLGDSFVWGTGVNENQTFSPELQIYLAGKLPGRTYRVYNLAVPASPAADVYAVLKKVGPLKPDLIILNTNYFFFSISEPEVHSNYPWLTANFADEPDRELIVAKLNVMTPEFRLGELVRKTVPLYRYREEVNIKLLGTNKPQEKFNAFLNTAVFKLRHTFGLEQGWQPKVNKAAGENLAWGYSAIPITPDRANYIFSAKIAAYLEKNRLNAAVFITPHNAKVVGKYQQQEGYQKNNRIIKNIFLNRSFSFFDYEDRLNDSLQTDNVHLSVQGSKEFARLLGDDIIPLLD